MGLSKLDIEKHMIEHEILKTPSANDVWLKYISQTGLTGDKTGSFDLTTTGNVGIETIIPLTKLQVGIDNVGEPVTLGTLTPKTIIMGAENNNTEDSLLRLIRPTDSGNQYPASVDFKVSSYGLGGPPTYSPETQLTIGLKASNSYDSGDVADVITLKDNGDVSIAGLMTSEEALINVGAGTNYLDISELNLNSFKAPYMVGRGDFGVRVIFIEGGNRLTTQTVNACDYGWYSRDNAKGHWNIEYTNTTDKFILKKSTTTNNILWNEAIDYNFDDNYGIYFGSGSDAKVYYDGTDLIIDPKAVGSGVVKVDGEVDILENISVGTDSPIFGFADTGNIYATNGIKTKQGLFSEAAKYGSGLEVSDNALVETYLSISGNATLTASTQTIYDPGATFIDSYVGQFIKILGSDPSYFGATGEIVAVTDTTHLIVSMATAGGAAIADATDVLFVIYPQPILFAGDNGDIHASVGADKDASFKISSPYGNNDHAVHIVADAGVNGHCGLDMDIDADTYGGVSGYCLNYDATGFLTGITGQGVNMVIDNNGATGGDFHGIDVAVTDPTNTDMETVAVGTNEGVEVIHQHLGDEAVVASAWLYDSSAGTYTDATTAFNSSGTNVQMFEGDNDTILIASATKFDQINVILALEASTNIRATFTFSLENTGWTVFTPADDTSGFQNNGTIRFDSDNLTNWDMQTVNQVTGETGSTDYYWIRIKRRRNIVPIPPIESTIQVTRTGTFHTWDKEGRLGIKTFSQDAEPSTTDLPSGRFCFWIDTNDSNSLWMCYNQDGTIKTTELT